MCYIILLSEHNGTYKATVYTFYLDATIVASYLLHKHLSVIIGCMQCYVCMYMCIHSYVRKDIPAVVRCCHSYSVHI